jgi:predicted ester cyclase
MAQDNGMIVRGFVDEVITKGNIEAAAKYIWEDVIEQVPLPGQGPGLNGLKDTIRAMRAGFPDIVFSIHEQIAEGDKVVSRFEWTGTHKGSFLGIPPTGRPVRVWGWSSTG